MILTLPSRCPLHNTCSSVATLSSTTSASGLSGSSALGPTSSQPLCLLASCFLVRTHTSLQGETPFSKDSVTLSLLWGSISTPSHLSKHLPNKDGSPRIKGIPGFSSDVKLFSPSSLPTRDEVPSRNGTTKLEYVSPSPKRSVFLRHLFSLHLLSVLLGASDRHKDSWLVSPSPVFWCLTSASLGSTPLGVPLDPKIPP